MAIRHAIGVTALIVFMGGAASAAPAYVKSTVNLRAGAGTNTEIVAKIPAGSLVDTSSCAEGWCEVTWQGKNGFAIATALDTSGRVPTRQAAPRAYGPGPDDADGYVPVTPPGAYYGPPVYYGYRPYYYGYGPYWGYRGWRRRW